MYGDGGRREHGCGKRVSGDTEQSICATSQWGRFG